MVEADEVVAPEADEVRRLTEALRQSEQRYRSVVEHSPDAILVHRHGKVLYLNPAGLRLYGAACLDELVGTELMDIIHPDDREALRQRIGRILKGERVPVAEFRVVPRGGGEPIIMETTAEVFDYDGAPAIHVIARDITARRRAERERAALIAQLAQSQKLDAVSQLAGALAHDVNNMLTVITTAATMARRRLSEDAPARADLDTILDTARRSAELTSQLLAFARKQTLQPRTFELAARVRASVDMLTRLVGTGITLRCVVADAAPWSVLADPSQVDQVVVNLVLNARDAMTQPGTITLAVRNVAGTASAPGRAGEYVELTCTDTGGGIAPELVDRIFEPFFTTKPSGQGTGLGLAIVHGIVQQHGGSITVDSTPGVGTTFRVLLPRAPASGAP